MKMKNPFTYAGLAALYIACIVLLIFGVSSFAGQNETLFIPMSVLGLLVLSVALMGFFFVSEPLFLALENKRRESLSFFFRTVGFFVCFVVLFVVVALLMSFV